jgi:hypothetical protein
MSPPRLPSCPLREVGVRHRGRVRRACGVRDGAVSDTHRVGGGVAETPRSGVGDRGAHHKGIGEPSSV